MQLLAYVRVSTDTQREDQTYETQEKYIRDYAQKHNHTILKWYQDLGFSGKKADNRPSFLKLKEDIRLKADGIIAFKLSRLGRSMVDLLNFFKFVNDDCQKSIILTNDPIDTNTPTGRLLLGILSSVVQFEREVIEEITTAGKIRNKLEGGKMGGPYKIEINKKWLEQELKRGLSPEHIGKLHNPVLSGRTVRRRMIELNLMESYKKGDFILGKTNF